MSVYKGKLAVVTGSAVGIGAAIVDKFIKGGLKVVGLDIRKKHVIENASYAPMMVDMTKQDDILKCFKEIQSKHGPIHVLVNNAGVLENTTLANADLSKLQRTVYVNILGMAICTREAVASMQSNNIDGHIVQICSILGHFIPKSKFNIYTATKHSVRAMAETIRLELKDENSKIKICSMCPGVVETELFRANDFEKFEGMKKVVDTVPKLRPQNIAEGIWYMIDQPPHVDVCTMIIRANREKL